VVQIRMGAGFELGFHGRIPPVKQTWANITPPDLRERFRAKRRRYVTSEPWID
jgi:hypothetical protein